MTTSPVAFALAYATGLVAFVFVVSAIAKIGHARTTMTAMVDLRVPLVFRRHFIARMLPVVEVLLAVGLLVLSGPWRAAAGAAVAVVLCAFTVLLLRVLLRGDEVDCGCFGALSAGDRVTWVTVARNGTLLVASLIIAVAGAPASAFWIELVAMPGAFRLGVLLAWAITGLLVLGAAAIALRGRPQITAASRRSDVESSSASDAPIPPLSPLSIALGLDPSRPGEVTMGQRIPDAELVTAAGHTQQLKELGEGNPVLLVFLSSSCSSCIPVGEAVPRWQESLPGIRIRVATSSSPREIAAAFDGVTPLARYGAQAARSAIGVQRSPAAVLLGGVEHQIIGSPIAYGMHEIEALVDSIRSLG